MIMGIRQPKNAKIVRTSYQIYLQILQQLTFPKMIMTMFVFLFGQKKITKEAIPFNREEDDKNA